MMEWLNAAFSVAGGGIFGLIGAGVNKFFDYKKQQQINIQELAMADKVAVQMDKEFELAKFKGSMELEIQDSDQIIVLPNANNTPPELRKANFPRLPCVKIMKTPT